MKIFKMVDVPATQRAVLVKRSCDLCGKESNSADWSSSLYIVAETEIEITISQKEGHQYPEGGSGTNYEIDLCPDCFTKKLVPWLISEGAQIKQENWEW